MLAQGSAPKAPNASGKESAAASWMHRFNLRALLLLDPIGFQFPFLHNHHENKNHQEVYLITQARIFVFAAPKPIAVDVEGSVGFSGFCYMSVYHGVLGRLVYRSRTPVLSQACPFGICRCSLGRSQINPHTSEPLRKAKPANGLPDDQSADPLQADIKPKFRVQDL